MNLDDVRDRLKAIAVNSDDDEAAHAMEDDLHQAALKSIADGTATNPEELAALVLTSLDIEFGRWCA